MATTTKNRYCHVYDCYPLYRYMYGGSHSSKYADTLQAASLIREAADRLKTRRPKLLELFYGQGDNEQLLMSAIKDVGINPATYLKTDINDAPTGTPDFIKADVLQLELSSANKVDVAFGLHYSGNIFLDRARYTQMLRSVFNCLKDKGYLIIDFSTNGYRTNFFQCVEQNGSDEYPIYYGNELRTLANFPLYEGESRLSFNKTTTYDRTTGISSEHLKDVTVNWKNTGKGKEKTYKIQIDNPIQFRYWSEIEIVEMAKDAGFTKFDFLSEGREEDGFFMLNLVETEITESDFEEDLIYPRKIMMGK